MKAGLVGAVMTLMLLTLVMAATSAGDDRSQFVATVGLAIDAPHMVEMERDAQAHMVEMARIEAERSQAMAQERTLRVYAVTAGIVTVALCVAGGLLIVRRPQRVVVVHRIEAGESWRVVELQAEHSLARWEEA